MSGWPEERSFEVEGAWISGWDFTVVLDDALVGTRLDEELDDLDERLAAAEGIAAVLHEDREVLYLRVYDLNVPEVEKKVHEAIEWTRTDALGYRDGPRDAGSGGPVFRQPDGSMLTLSPSAWRSSS